MAAEFPKVEASGTIKEITLGEGEKSFTLGGENAYPFHTFEGQTPHKAKIAMEIWDITPDDWADSLNSVYSDCYGDPVAWAKKCVEFGADAIVLTLKSTDPNEDNAPVGQAVETVKKVAAAIDVPLIVWGVDNEEKDGKTLRAVAEGVDFKQLILGPVVEGNYKQVGAGAIGYKHKVVANTPIDINLAKQLNILLGNLGMADENILIDPTVGGLGYGLEYTYTVMERARMAALMQGDEKLAFPMFVNIGKEVWKTKEAKAGAEEPTWGDPVKRGVTIEGITAVSLLLAGADILVLRHPESLKYVREYIEEMSK